jgi:hypothetical protein
VRWLSDDQLGRLHRWAVRYVVGALPVEALLLLAGVRTGWGWLAWPVIVLLAGQAVAFYGVCGLCAQEKRRRGWAFGEWTPARRLGPFTWHQPAPVEPVDDGGPT